MPLPWNKRKSYNWDESQQEPTQQQQQPNQQQSQQSPTSPQPQQQQSITSTTMSQLMFWNKQNNNNNNNNNNSNNNNNNSNTNNNNNSNNSNNKDSNTNGTSNDGGKNGKRNWLHTPEALINGHVVYLVKFFGNLPVDQAKGIDVVKDAIRKLQFAQQMRKAETGTQEKFKKVEITISVDGVAVQEPRTQKILHQFPLHNISYCADEKGVKKFFSFIAKTTKATAADGSANGLGGTSLSSSSNGSTNGTTADDTHECFVFISSKLASDITLTIGQAFDLAYRKYINTAEKNDLAKAQQQIGELEKTIAIYKERLQELAVKLPKSELDSLLVKLNIKDVLEVPPSAIATPLTNGTNAINGKLAVNEDKLLIDTNSTHSSKSSNSSMSSFVPIVPPRNNLSLHKASSNSNNQKMEELLLNSDSDSDFDPRADEMIESNSNSSNGRNDSNDLFGFEPPAKSYGQQLFHNNNNNNNNNNSSTNNIIMNNNNNSNNNNNNDNRLHNNNNNNMNGSNGFNIDFNVTPLLAPPPKVAAPRRSTSVITNTNNVNNTNNLTMTNGITDLFGSDPFDISFKTKPISVDDFSLESLDPLRK